MSEEKPLNNKYKSIGENDVVENVDGMPFPKDRHIEHFNKENLEKINAVEENQDLTTSPKEKKVKEPKPPKEKKVKEPKPPKEKKVKEPKPPKEKKVKEPKPPKEKKVKEPKPPKEKKVKEPKPPKEKKVKEPLNGKDIATIVVLIVAILSASFFGVYKFHPELFIKSQCDGNTNNPNKCDTASIEQIEIARKTLGITTLIESDINNIFYGFTADNQIKYFQYGEKSINEINPTAEISLSVDLGNQSIPVTIKYIDNGTQKFGIGIFTANENDEVYFYKEVVFKITDLPQEYREDGKVLLLMSASESALSMNDVIWTESFILNLSNGTMSRFLTNVNRTLDDTGAGVNTFCMINRSGYTASSVKIPFLTSRKYGPDEKKRDIFIKNGKKETILCEDVYTTFLLRDNDSVIYLKKTVAGFDIMKNSDGKDTIVKSLCGPMSDYLITDNYIINRIDGTLINMITGEEKVVLGYKMSPEIAKVSPDGRYLITIGTIKSVIDYQIHIFDLQNGDYYEYKDTNHAIHSNIEFLDNNTVVYSAADPENLSEYVLLDLTKLK